MEIIYNQLEGISGNIVSAFYSGYKYRLNGEIKSGKDGFYYGKQKIIREIYIDCKQ